MKIRFRSFLVTMGCLVSLAAGGSAVAAPFSIPCNTGGDASGWTVAVGGDFDGDGTADIAIGAPCATTHKINLNAGTVTVISGRTHKTIMVARGREPNQFLGMGLAFLDDINNDGKDELIIGSPGYDVTGDDDPSLLDDVRTNGGKVQVVRIHPKGKKRPRIVKRLYGTDRQGGFGETVVPLGDVDGDARMDYAVGAGNERNSTGGRAGRIYLVSGRTGAILASRTGPTAGDHFGRVMANVGDMNGDGLPDLAVGAPDAKFRVRASGLVQVLDGRNLATVLLETGGARNDKMGTAVAAAGDVDDDGVTDLVIGSGNADDAQGVRQGGEVSVVTATGGRWLAVSDPEPQEKAHFGESVAALGDIDGDTIPDFAAASPDWDVIEIDGDTETVRSNAGKVVALRGVDGTPLWERGTRSIGALFGSFLSAHVDYNGDGLVDLVVGARGDTVFGRRGAGSTTILSGLDGTVLDRFAGRRGLQTVLFAAGDGPDGRPVLRGFSPSGPNLALQAKPFPSGGEGDLSVAVIDDRGKVLPDQVQVAVGAGYGSTDSSIYLFRASRKNELVTTLEGMPNNVDSGVVVGAGRLDTGPRDLLVAAQADSKDGTVVVRIFNRFEDTETWLPLRQFRAFRPDDDFQLLPINAGGATLAVGNVTGGSTDEIVVGTRSGLPVVRIFSSTGKLIREWLAYDPDEADGVNVAIVNIAGGQSSEIVTVPRTGTPVIKLFRGSGDRVLLPGELTPVEILPNVPPGFTAGGVIAAADVDLDNGQEILFVPGDGLPAIVSAFEADGTPSPEFRRMTLSPSGPVAIAATDSFVRR